MWGLPLSKQVRELKALGFGERGPVLEALYQNSGDLWRALVQLQRLRLEPFHQRLWEPEEPPIDFHSPDRQVRERDTWMHVSRRCSDPHPTFFCLPFLQAVLRRLLASLSLPSWGRAELVVSLMLEQPSEGGWDLADIVEAVMASPSRDFIKRLLNWECAVCGIALPRNKVPNHFGKLTPDCLSVRPSIRPTP